MRALFQIPPYDVNAAPRAPVPQVANVQDDQTELFMVLDGTGSIVWGGKVAGATRSGANVTGKAIDGGTTHLLFKKASYGSAIATALAAQPVAMAEIHWSCPYGNPLSKNG